MNKNKPYWYNPTATKATINYLVGKKEINLLDELNKKSIENIFISKKNLYWKILSIVL